MNFLLDTHVAIWAVEDSPRLSKRARQLLLEPDALLMVGVVSLWEIAIKHSLGRKGAQAMPMSAAEARGYFEAAGMEVLPVKVSHILQVEQLERFHDDPFDRLLVATAVAEGLTLLTQDDRLSDYGPAVTRC